MKKISCLILCLTALAGPPSFAQQSEKPAAPTAPARRELSKFNLEFPGGTPAQLVATIQKAMGRSLNVVVPDDLANWRLPPMKMTGVDVSQLFRALEQAGLTQEVVANGNGSYSQRQFQYGFRTNDNNPQTQTDDTIWYFYVNGTAKMPKISRFYLLTPYLDAGLTVDDITTAIQTGWKMRGDTTPPTLNFHKETKLLIAVGDYGGLDVIDQVLKALDPLKPKPRVELSEAEAQVLKAIDSGKAKPAAADKPAPEAKTKP